MSALADRGIRLRSEMPGEHRAICPACAGRKLGRRAQELAVKVEPDGSAVWHCWSVSCGWKGALRPPGSPLGREKPRAKGARATRPPETRPTPPAAAPEPHPNMAAAQEVWRQTVEITDDLPLT